jgi:hypothetical protein
MTSEPKCFVCMPEITCTKHTVKPATVVNIKHKDCEVFGGRPSQLGNKHRIGWCSFCKCSHSRAEAIAAFKQDFDNSLNGSGSIQWKLYLSSLRGKVLGCYCKPQACHLDVIVEYLNNSRVSEHLDRLLAIHGLPYQEGKENNG